MTRRLLLLIMLMSLSASVHAMGMMPRGKVKTDETKVLTETTSSKIATTSKEVSTETVQVDLKEQNQLNTTTTQDAAAESLNADSVAR